MAGDNIEAVTMALVMFGIIWKLRRHHHAEGWLFGWYCVFAGVERFIVEFFRAKDDVLAIGLTIAQIIAIAVVLLGFVILMMRRRPQPVVRSTVGA